MAQEKMAAEALRGLRWGKSVRESVTRPSEKLSGPSEKKSGRSSGVSLSPSGGAPRDGLGLRHRVRCRGGCVQRVAFGLSAVSVKLLVIEAMGNADDGFCKPLLLSYRSEAV